MQGLHRSAQRSDGHAQRDARAGNGHDVVTLRQLRAHGYPLLYREFDDEHVIPPAVAQEAVDWFTGAAA